MFNNTRNVEIVDLSANNISSIENGTFSNCGSLVKLVLSHNPIVRLQYGAFTGLSHLRNLYLRGVHLKSLHKESLQGLQRVLYQVVIIAPYLCDIEPGLFEFTTLSFFTISSDCLRNLSGRIFSPTNSPYVGSIHIQNMPNLQEISPNAFDGISYFGDLRIRSTKLTRLPEGLFGNTSILNLADLSKNRLEDLPDNFLQSSPTLNARSLFSNNLTHVSAGVFAGLKSLRILLLFHNRLTEIPELTHLPKLESLYLFDNNISYVGNTSLKTSMQLITTLHMYYNPITTIEDYSFDLLARGGKVFMSTGHLYQLPKYLSDITLFSIGTDVEDVKWTVRNQQVADCFGESGFNCYENKTGHGYVYECVPCRVGYYAKHFKYEFYNAPCTACPSGGFYQDKIGQDTRMLDEIGCEKCNPGTFVPLKQSPGTKAEDCQVCPTGTDKATFAGFRACSCLDGYFRTDRFDACEQCPDEGIDCSWEYQTLETGYWWIWNFDGNETAGYIEMLKYKEFVKNIRTMDDSYDKNTVSYNGRIPKPFKCPKGNKSCPVKNIKGDEHKINPSCGTGYEGWLCSSCSNRYYPWFEYCLECPSWSWLAVEIVIVIVVVVAIISVAIWNYKKEDRSTRSPLDTLVGRFKIVLAYYQIAGAIFTSIHDIQWPMKISQLAGIFRYLELNIFKLLAKPSCFLDVLRLNIYSEFVIGITFCAVVILLPYIIYVCLKLHNLCRFRHVTIPNGVHDWMKKQRAKCYFAVVVLLFITFPSICQVILGLMPPACDEFCLVANRTNCTYNVSKLRSDYAINCNSPTHMNYQMAAYICLIYVVGFPISTFFLIKTHVSTTGKCSVQTRSTQTTKECGERSTASTITEDERSLNSDGNVQRELLSISGQPSNDEEEDDENNAIDGETLSESDRLNDPLLDRVVPSPNSDPLHIRFLCENYKPKYWFWEIIELSRKLVQTSLVVLWGSEDPFTLGLSIAISVVYTVIHAYVKPMKDTFEHWLQMLSLMAIFFNLLAAIYFKVPYSDHRQELMTAFILIVNLSVVLLAVGNVLIVTWKTVRRQRCNGNCTASCLCCCATVTRLATNVSAVSQHIPP
ncbi:uncharacterized protein [Amphiura filiformis]|uniref:uncharacterized protein n=1 Tax=Amphiura filiformis TaxID=82378 RepID=UPI003B212EDF